MTIHTTGSNGITLFLDRDDLRRVGSNLDSASARGLVRDTMRNMGLLAEPREISAFMGRDSAMVIALWDDDAPLDWIFFQTKDSDALLEMRGLAEEHGAALRLYRVGGVYYAALCEQTAPDGLAGMLTEYGSRVFRPASYLTFLEEHSSWNTDG
ncbi:hypothetical protein FACS18949_03500 [Clostridia bacterium]|nr:hypothetical protein FACS18949_03500 [Clostridia bacterium]